jgi:nucleotide-binding universal stress UspA family protein
MAVGRRLLERMRELARRARVRSEQEILEGDAAQRIVEFAQSRGAQLIVLGARRRRPRISVSQRVISTSPVPVLVRTSTPQRTRGTW